MGFPNSGNRVNLRHFRPSLIRAFPTTNRYLRVFASDSSTRPLFSRRGIGAQRNNSAHARMRRSANCFCHRPGTRAPVKGRPEFSESATAINFIRSEYSTRNQQQSKYTHRGAFSHRVLFAGDRKRPLERPRRISTDSTETFLEVYIGRVCR